MKQVRVPSAPEVSRRPAEFRQLCCKTTSKTLSDIRCVPCVTRPRGSRTARSMPAASGDASGAGSTGMPAVWRRWPATPNGLVIANV